MNKADNRPYTEFLRTQLVNPYADMNFEFETGINYIHSHFWYKPEKYLYSRMFWNWWKLQWENRTRFMFEILAISTNQLKIDPSKKKYLFDTYYSTHTNYISTPIKPSKNLIKQF